MYLDWLQNKNVWSLNNFVRDILNWLMQELNLSSCLKNKPWSMRWRHLLTVRKRSGLQFNSRGHQTPQK